jgi:DNA-binding response OmpR family regulator
MTNELSGLRVMIVEDEFLIAMLLEDLLTELGCAVSGSASKPAQAFKLLESEDVDVAVLDVNLEGSDSFGVAAVLKDKKIPFIFATGYGGSRVPQEFSPYPVIQKPYRLEELSAALDGLWRRAKKANAS